MSTPTPDNPTDHTGRATISGRTALLGMFLFLVLTTVLTYALFGWATSRTHVAPLDWSKRAAWASSPVQTAALYKDALSGFFKGDDANGQWRDLQFRLTREQEEAMRDCVRIVRNNMEQAGSADAFKKRAVGQALSQIAKAHPKLSYPQYLLGTWHRLNGDQAAADAAYQKAFALADDVIKQQFTGPDSKPATHRAVGTFELALGRIVNKNLDDSLHLVYPQLVTDERGFIYLPVPHTVYRIVAEPAPANEKATYPRENWFDVPYRIGTLDPVILHKETTNLADFTD